MNKKLLIVVALAGAVLLAFALFGRRALSPHRTLYLTPPIATNFRYPAQFSTDEAYYFNGSSFLTFNLSSQTSKTITPVYSLPNVLDVQWSKTGALFKANDYGVFDQLKPILEQKRLPTTATYWWSVNFANGEIKLLGSPKGPSSDATPSNGTTVSSATWSNDGKSYFYVQTKLLLGKTPENTLYTGSLINVDKALAKIDGSNLVWAGVNQAAYLIDADSKHTLALFNGQARTIQNLLENFSGPIQLSANGQTALIIAVPTKSGQEILGDSKGPLQIINLQDNSTPQTITKIFSGTFVWSKSGDSWAAMGLNDKNKLTGYASDDSHPALELSFKLRPRQATPDHIKIVAYENQQILLTDASNNAYLASPVELNTKAIQLFKPSEWNYSGSEELMKHGLTNVQLTSLKYALHQYTLGSSQNPQQVKISNISLEPFDRKNPTGKAIANFTLTLDKTNYGAKLEYFDLTSIRLYLYDAKSKSLIYDSKTINNRTSQ